MRESPNLIVLRITKYINIPCRMTIKTCKDCKQPKQISEFKYRKDRNYYEPRCKPCEKIYRRNLRQNNREKYLQKDKKYYEKNKKQYNKRSTDYYEKNKEKIKKQRKQFREKNKKEILERERNRYKEKKTNPNFIIKESLRKRLLKVLIDNNTETKRNIKYYGASLKFVREWFEFNFKLDEQFDMNWANHGDIWEIDHVIPCDNFNFKNIKERFQCLGWFNLLPVPKSYNRQKSNKIIKNDILKLQLRVYLFNKSKAITTTSK